MSPEQASGKQVDKRSDIWSFGVLLWELLTGEHLFEGETTSHILAEVLRGPIDFGKLPHDMPQPVDNLLRRCLDRNVKNRLRDIGEARVAIDAALNGSEAPPPAAERQHRVWFPWSIAAALALFAAPLAYVHFREQFPLPAATVRFQLPLPGAIYPWAVLSPDGRKLAFPADHRLRVHFLDSGEIRDLSQFDGSPVWSPDSRALVYPYQNKIRKIDASGGSSQMVTDFSGTWGGGDWSQDDMIVFSANPTGLFKVPALGGSPIQITAVDAKRQETGHSAPSYLPDGHHFIYLRKSVEMGKTAVFLGSLDSKPQEQSLEALLFTNYRPLFTNPGYLLFIREDTLMSQPFNPRKLKLTGPAIPVAERVADPDGGGFGAFSASRNGVLTFRQSGGNAHPLTWTDKDGSVLKTIGEAHIYQDMALSPDATHVAWSEASGKTANIWLMDLTRGVSRPFTTGATKDAHPVWSPDGRRLVFSSGNDIYLKDISGAKDAEVLLKAADEQWPNSWSPDGRFLLYTVFRSRKTRELWVLSLRTGKSFPFGASAAVGYGRFSPDGRRVAYLSVESGKAAICLQSFSTNAAGTQMEASTKWRVSTEYGFDPRWRGDGRELFYHLNDGTVMAADVGVNGPLQVGKPHSVGTLRLAPTDDAWEVSPDGTRFLAAGAGGYEPLTVILNWQNNLKKTFTISLQP